MKKRLRKKTHRGEFKELGFALHADYEAFEDYDSLYDFIDELLFGTEKLGADVGGNFDFAECDLAINVGQTGPHLEERRNAVIEFIKAMPGVKQVEAGELVDAWYGNLD